MGCPLPGEKPAEMPVMQRSNMRSFRTLGIEVPPALQAIADDMIE